MLLLVFVVILEIVFGVSSSAHQHAWIVCIAIMGVIFIYLFISNLIGTFILRNKYVDIKSSKLKQPLRIIHISDTHIGSRSQSFLDKVIQQVNELQGDIICITGDLVDSFGVISEVIPDYQDNQQSDKSVLQPNPYPVLRSLEKLTAKVGVYFVIGNHDFYLGKENVVKMIQHFPNPHKRAWLKAMDLLHGDLFLAGHTHNGQIFPGNLLVHLIYPHPAGLLTIKANDKKDELKYDQQQNEVNKQEQLHSFNRHLYVNPGTGTWGSPARSSGFSEITIINISPE
ncbi:MAG: hypothetical protein EZS28_021267 [Streblomastix strix]|uniref:Calcineurin-like phosphoesterase domain-containing protein n=1 Tax=Streblomastix strix TaxID=222440 RepID=A0A5J4VL28_9EUKA|nr:MAG: hypothetical protein EZS28_021267 [Streblomastix strix]